MREIHKNVLPLCALAFLVFANGASAQTPTAPKPPVKRPTQAAKAPAAKPAPLEAPQLKFEKYKLQNGLEVILSEDHRLPMVAGNLWYHVGAANEVPGRTGFAHLFENKMFLGSRDVPGTRQFHFLETACASGINSTQRFGHPPSMSN